MGLMMAQKIFREVLEIVEPFPVQKKIGNESHLILSGTEQCDIQDIEKITIEFCCVLMVLVLLILEYTFQWPILSEKLSGANRT
jgi:hypothetical protein